MVGMLHKSGLEKGVIMNIKWDEIVAWISVMSAITIVGFGATSCTTELNKGTTKEILMRACIIEEYNTALRTIEKKYPDLECVDKLIKEINEKQG